MQDYSVLMSVYMKEKPEYLRQSIQSMLDQTVPANDFVIVCDGPLTKELDEVLTAFTDQHPKLFQMIRLEENKGLGNALNVGMKYCKNELVARMDSDDISLADRCEKQLKKFENDPSLDVVSGTIAEFDQTPGRITAEKCLPERNDEIYRYAKLRCPFNHPAVMYRKTAVQKAGGYQDFPLFEDYYLWVRMLQRSIKAYNIREPLVLMRAGELLYNRRGGFGYFKKVYSFRKYMYTSGFISLKDCIITLVGQALVCGISNQLRVKIYRIFLRKSV